MKLLTLAQVFGLGDILAVSALFVSEESLTLITTIYTTKKEIKWTQTKAIQDD
jgi:hypothetical protein